MLMAESSSSSSVSVDSESTAGSTSSSSLLSFLRCPKPSELTRKRKTQQNPPPLGKRRARGHGAFDPKSVSPAIRVREYPGESLSVSNQKVFCNACREELGLKSSVVNNHIKSTKHTLGKE